MSETPTPTVPKLFISYSWTTADHQAWVENLGRDLMANGIEVILDLWHLRPGHNSISFMEQMVTDAAVNKVLMIFDAAYVKKSDNRVGGAGTEAQIITPELYAAQRQDKFAAVVRERDENGEPYVPTYYKGRIYFDMTNPATTAEEFNKIVRWAHDRPLYVPPVIGGRPAFLDEKPSAKLIDTGTFFRRAIDDVRGQLARGVSSSADYLDTVATGIEKLRIKMTNANRDTFHEEFVESIDQFTPYKNELIQFFLTVAGYSAGTAYVKPIVRFFEKLIPYMRDNLPGGSYDVDLDNFKFISHELFLSCAAAFCQRERFDLLHGLVETEYYTPGGMENFAVFREYVKSADIWRDRTKTNHIAPHALLLQNRVAESGLELKSMVAADMLLFLRSHQLQIFPPWYPETLIFAERLGSALEIFARSKSSSYFGEVAKVVGAEHKSDIELLLQQFADDPNLLPRWNFNRPNMKSLLAFDDLATSP